MNVFGDWELEDYGVPAKAEREACAKAPLSPKPSRQATSRALVGRYKLTESSTRGNS